MAITNLSEYYQSQGQALPSVQQRATLASQAGIQGYTGSTQQNNQLLGFLQGQNNGTVAAPALGNVQPIKVPPPQDSTAQLNSLVASYNPIPLQEDVAKAEGAVQTGANDLTKLMSQLEGYGAEQNTLSEEAGIPTINKDLMELQNIARQKNIQYNTAFNTAEANNVGRGVVSSLVQGEAALRQRNLATDIMLTNSSIQAKQGDLALAQQTVQNALDAKYEPLKARIETQKFILDQNRDNLSRADRKLADERTNALNLQLKKIEQEQQREKSIEDMIIEAAAFQAPNSVIITARNIAAKGGKPSEVASVLGQFSGASANAELLKERLKTEKAQQQKIYTDIAQTKAEMSGIGGGISQETVTKAIESKSGQRAISTKNLVQQLANLSDLYEQYGSRPKNADAIGRINSARSTAQLAIAEAFGQGAIQEGDRKQYEGMIGTTFGIAPTARLKQAIQSQQNNYRTQLDTLNTAYPGVGELETFRISSPEDDYVNTVVSAKTSTESLKNSPLSYAKSILGLK